MMGMRYGRAFTSALLAPPQAVSPGGGLLARILELCPATLPFGLYGAWLALRRVLARDEEDRSAVGGTLCLAWLAIALVVPSVLARGPRPALNLLLLIPLNLFASAVIVDLSSRKINARVLCGLASATVATTAWWTSTHLREAASDLVTMQAPEPGAVLGLRLALGLAALIVLVIRGLDKWSQRDDARRRVILGTCLAAVIGATIAAGIREVRFRHRETSEILAMRDAVLRRRAERPFTTLAVVSPHGPGDGTGLRPGGRLRFLLRATLPELPQIDIANVDDLKKLPPGQRLVILAGTKRRFDYAAQSSLGLEAIYPGRSGNWKRSRPGPTAGRSCGGEAGFGGWDRR